jgi:translocation and assembly module TamB
VVGRPPREQPAARHYPLDLDLDLDLGGDFLFKGGGLDARLGGRLRVFTVDQTLRGEGRVQVETGRYAAYGQSLAIERGVLAFAGPIDNPGLDILAVRETATVKAGVQVRGTARRPLVTLYSEPPLPDTEKLAWLVLGHGLDRGGQQEFALLQVAVGTLLGQAESVTMQARLADALHIDSFSLQAGEGEDLSSSVIRVGKRLSSRATLSYEQSLDGLDQVVKVIYQWTPRVRLEARTGQRGSFDAFYTVEYD